MPELRKLLLLDTGVFQRLLQLNIGDLLIETDFDLVNKGAIARAVCGPRAAQGFFLLPAGGIILLAQRSQKQ